MRQLIVVFLATFLLVSCSSDNTRHKNPYLPNYSFSRIIDTKMPLHSALSSPMNPKFIPDDGQSGNLIVMKISDTDYRAFDATCPNQYPTNCSVMFVEGLNAVCPCDDIKYSLFTGVALEGGAEYPMKSFRIDIMGNGKIRIFN